LRPPFIKDSHHQVLEAWAMASTRENAPLDLFTLDYHMDTLPAFSARLKGRDDADAERARLLAEVDWKSDVSVRDVITRLRYDEHIDCARRVGILGTIVIGLGCREPQNVPEFATLCMPEDRPVREMVDALLEDETLAPWIAVFEEKRGKPLEASGYIFDIDLDYFRTERSAQPITRACFDRLLRHATLITIAREPGCVGLLRLPGEYIIASDLEKIMLAHLSRRG
jgi:hypothetical protein